MLGRTDERDNNEAKANGLSEREQASKIMPANERTTKRYKK